MQYKFVKTNEELIELRTQWEILQSEIPTSCFYDTYEYFYAWWMAYGKEKSLFIICIMEGNQLIGLAPLIIYDYSIKYVPCLSIKTCSFIDRGDFHNFLIHPKHKAYSVIKKIFNVLEQYRAEWERLWLVRINPNESLGNYILSSDVYNEYFKHKFVCPYVDIDEENKKVYASVFPTRKQVKQDTKALKKLTGYSLKIVNGGGQEIYELISSLHLKEKEFLVTEKGRKERKSHFELTDKKYLETLYIKSDNIITFFLATEEGEILAYNTCYVFHNIMNSWNIAYNPQYQKYSPSNVLYYEIVQHLFQNDKYMGYRFDFGSGNYPWKHRFTNKGIYNFSLDYLNESYKGKQIWKGIFCIRDIIRVLKSKY